MALRSRMARWVVLVVAAFVAGLCLVALGVFFALQGLDRADKFGSAIGVFVGLAGLGFSGYGAWLARQARVQPPGNSSPGRFTSGTVVASTSPTPA